MSQSKLQAFISKVQQHRGAILVGPMATRFPTDLPAGWPVIGVDGGSSKGPREKYDFTLGDGDSLNPSINLDLVFPAHKDASDLSLALSHLLSGPWTLHLHGFWGGRFDHQIVNLGELHAWLNKEFGQVIFHTETEYQLLGLPAGKHTLELEGEFSLFSPTQAQFSIEGDCRYPLSPTVVAPMTSRLLSNEAFGFVTITSSEAFFCYRRNP